MMARCVSCRTAIVVLVLAFTLLSFTSASRHILQSDKLTPLDISKDEGSQGGAEPVVRYATTGEESEREVPTGPDPIHHHGAPKTRSAFSPKTRPDKNTVNNVAAQHP